MAIPAEPATSAIFRALRSVDVDPDLAYEAAEESRRQAGRTSLLPSELRSPSSRPGSIPKVPGSRLRSPSSRPRLKLNPRGLTFSSG